MQRLLNKFSTGIFYFTILLFIMSQLSVGLSFQEGPGNGTYPYTVTSPSYANIAPPGLYMLFVLRNKSESLSGETMIPSEAKIVMLN